jgi:hypothetical protein
MLLNHGALFQSESTEPKNFFLTGATAGVRQPEQLYRTKNQGIITTILEGGEKQEA